MQRQLPSFVVPALMCLLLNASSVLADGVVRDGIGAISSGRGGTNIAHADNGAVLLDNPAALANVAGGGLFEIGADTVITDMDYSDPLNGADANFWPIPLPFLSYVRKSSDDVWAVGLGAFGPAGFGAEWDLNSPVFGESRYKSFGALLKILPGVACRLTDRLSVGASFGVALTHVELEGPMFLQTGPFAGTPLIMDLLSTGVAPTWSAGLQYDLSDRTTIGLAYTSESRFRMDGSLNATVPGLGTSRFDAGVDVAWPRSAGFGIKHNLCQHQRVSADVIWYDWASAFDGVDLELTNASNPQFTNLLGPTIRDRLPLDWRDSVSLRLGYEYFPTACVAWRAGYVYHQNPIPDATLTPYIPAILEHAFSLGCSRRWYQTSVNLSYQFSFGPEQHVGTSALAGGNFNSSDVKAQAHWINLSLLQRF